MTDRMEMLAQREISATARWGVSLLVGLILQGGAIFFWAATMQERVDAHTKEIESLQNKVETINDDIRNILVGIEQVKARLGIVEVK